MKIGNLTISNRLVNHSYTQTTNNSYEENDIDCNVFCASILNDNNALIGIYGQVFAINSGEYAVRIDESVNTYSFAIERRPSCICDNISILPEKMQYMDDLKCSRCAVFIRDYIYENGIKALHSVYVRIDK